MEDCEQSKEQRSELIMIHVTSRWRNDLEFRTLNTIMSTAENRVELSNKTALIPVNTKTKISHAVRSEGLSKIQMLGSLNE